MKKSLEISKSRKVMIFIFLFLLLVTSFLLKVDIGLSLKEDKLNETYLSNELIAHAPIHIDDDSDFIEFPGLGSFDDPYIIENYNITSDVESCGINISATAKFFIIRNCFIDALDFGIWISWISEGTAQVINNTCVNHYSTGIDLWDAPGAILSNNKLHHNRNGIYCVISDSIRLENNNCTNNQLKGVSVRFCDNAIIENNYCSENEIGIETFFSRNFNITSNQVTLNTKGIQAFNVLSATVSKNIISKNTGNGIIIEESMSVSL
ncbi:MAG: right-handed parallel beta-helix repeat-containing protein, partial [Candidatus Thorarchaeota archaeon]